MFVEPTAPDDEFFSKIANVSDRATEATNAEFAESAQHFETRTGLPAFLIDFCRHRRCLYPVLTLPKAELCEIKALLTIHFINYLMKTYMRAGKIFSLSPAPTSSFRMTRDSASRASMFDDVLDYLENIHKPTV